MAEQRMTNPPPPNLPPPPPPFRVVVSQSPAVPLLLAINAVLLGIIAFWVVATPHEQCYISDGSLFADEQPIERIPGDRYRGVPSEFQEDGSISAEAVIECRWELGTSYRAGIL